MITIHARTYNQSHAGEVDRDFVYRLKKALPDKIIIGNGGIRSYDDAVAQVNNLDGIMIGQSAIGNPWILTPHIPTREEKFTTIFRHLDMMMASERLFQERLQTMEKTLSLPTYQELEAIMHQKPRLTNPESTSRVAFEFRKYLFNYVSGLEGNKALKQQIPHWKTYNELKNGLEIWYNTTPHIQK